MTAFAVDGHVFDVQDGRFTSRPDGFEPLCEVIHTAWIYGPTAFLEAVIARGGQSFEGEVAWAYSGEDAEIPAGQVALFYLDDAPLFVTERFFEELVARHALLSGRAPEIRALAEEIVRRVTSS
jgi:hypothetical protein